MDNKTRAQVALSLTLGVTFDTPFEKGCVVAGPVDAGYSFDAYDSDGVLCSFGVAMVTAVRA